MNSSRAMLAVHGSRDGALGMCHGHPQRLARRGAAPDLESKIPYLIPYDGNPDFPKKSCYSLESMYAALGKLGARSVTVALDACFRGTASRTDGATALLANARPLFVAPVASLLPEGVAVLAAAGERVLVAR